jgi:hypothetical protein
MKILILYQRQDTLILDMCSIQRFFLKTGMKILRCLHCLFYIHYDILFYHSVSQIDKQVFSKYYFEKMRSSLGSYSLDISLSVV